MNVNAHLMGASCVCAVCGSFTGTGTSFFLRLVFDITILAIINQRKKKQNKTNRKIHNTLKLNG